MAQNLISLDLTDELPKFDAALDAIEQLMDIFVSLTPEQMRRLFALHQKVQYGHRSGRYGQSAQRRVHKLHGVHVGLPGGKRASRYVGEKQKRHRGGGGVMRRDSGLLLPG